MNLSHRFSAREHGARDDPLLTVRELTRRQLVGGSADTRAHDARTRNRRAGERNDAFELKLSCLEERADGGDILAIDVPNVFVLIDGVQSMNVIANGTRGVRAAKARVPEAIRHRNVRLFGSADVDRTIGQLRHHREASLEGTAATLDYLFHVGSQWIRVHRRDKDGVRYNRGIRDTAERSPAQSRPFSGLQEKGNYLFTRRANGAFSRERFEAHLIGCTDTARAIGARKLEHHRLEGAALAAMDGNHFAGARRRETDTWRLFVFQ